MFQKSLFVFIISILILSALSSSYAMGSDDTIFRDGFENTTDYLIRPSGDLYISLTSNPSTGYAWNYTSTSDNVKIVDHIFLEDNAYVPAVGIGGVDCYKFNLESGGIVKLTFTYKRSWEDNTYCKKEFIILIY